MSVSLLLLLLAATSARAGRSYERFYGESIRIRMRSDVRKITFEPVTSSESVIVWQLRGPPLSGDRRQLQVIDGDLLIVNMTHLDSGGYRLLGSYDKVLNAYTITVKERNMNFKLSDDELLNFTFPLRTNRCNIYFFPEEHNYGYETKLIHNGIRMPTDSDCYGYSFTKPCGLKMKMAKSCAGFFEVRDENDGVALSVRVDFASGGLDWKRIGTGIGVSFASMVFCSCVKCCCCKKKSKKKDADPEVTEPVYTEYDHEPVAQRPAQTGPPPQMLYPAQPSYAPTGLQIHNPPPVYSQGSAPAEHSYTPSFLPSSDTELQFELKGMDLSSAPPLSSESTNDSVYTSNKLNFL